MFSCAVASTWLLFFLHCSWMMWSCVGSAVPRTVAGTPPEVSIRHASDPGTFGPNDVVIVLFTPSRPFGKAANETESSILLRFLKEAAADNGQSAEHAWAFVVAAHATLHAFREQVVLDAGPSQWSGYNFHLLFADTCPGGLDSVESPDPQCGTRHSLHMLTEIFTAGDPAHRPVAAIGGHYWGLEASLWLSSMDIPTLSPVMSSQALDDRQLYPYFLRTHISQTDQSKGTIRVLEHFGYTHAVHVHDPGSDQGGTASSLVLEAAKADPPITLTSIVFSLGPHEIYAPEEGSPRRLEWESIVDRMKRVNAHCLLLSAAASSPWIQFTAFLHEQGLVGQGYMWIHSSRYAEGWRILFDVLETYGLTPAVPHVSPMTHDGVIAIEKTEEGPMWSPFREYLLGFQLPNRTSEIPEWLQEHIKDEPADFWDPNPINYPHNRHHLFDGLYSLLWAVNDLIIEQSGLNFSATALRDRMWASDFDGAGGRVKFNALGSREAEFRIMQFQPPCDTSGARRLPAPQHISEFVLVGSYKSLNDELQIQEADLLFYNCSKQVPPDQDLVCGLGMYYHRRTATCESCEPGSFASSSIEAVDECTQCGPGYFASGQGSSTCSACPPGEFAAALGLSQCQPCEAGKYQRDPASSECETCGLGRFSGDHSIGCEACPAGTFGNATAASSCHSCQPGRTTDSPGETRELACACRAGQVDVNGVCQRCPEGLRCQFGSSVDAWLATGGSGGHSSGIYPKLLPGFWASVDDPLDVYRCEGAARCPGGDPGTCASTLSKQSCSRCGDEEWWDSQECRKCKLESSDAWIFPYIPVLGTPMVLMAMYQLHGDSDGLTKWRTWVQKLSDFLFVVMNHCQVMALIGQVNVAVPSTTSDTNDAWGWMLDWLSLFRIECAGFTGVQSEMLLRTFAPMLLGVWTMVLYLILKLVSMLLGKPELQMRLGRMFNVVMSIIFSFFTAVIAMTLLLYKCEGNPNGTSSLRADRSVTCYEQGDWMDLLAISIFAVAFYCGGMAMLFVWAIVAAKRHFRQNDFQLQWKFLFVRYRLNAWWWSLSFLGKNVLFNAALVITSNGLGQLYLMMAILCLYLLLVFVFMPYRSALANFIEIISCLGAIGSAAFMTHFAEDVQSHFSTLDNISTILMLIPIVFAVACAIFVIAQHVRHMRMRRPGEQSSDEQHSEAAQESLSRRLVNAAAAIIEVNSSGKTSMLDGVLSRVDEWDRLNMKRTLVVLEAELMGIPHMRLAAAEASVRGSRVARLTEKVAVSRLSGFARSSVATSRPSSGNDLSSQGGDAGETATQLHV